METIGDKIKRLRKSKGLSISQLSDLLIISDMTLSKIETGKTKSITVELGKKLCFELGISFNELFEIEDINTDLLKISVENDLLNKVIKEKDERIFEKDLLIKTLNSQLKLLKKTLFWDINTEYTYEIEFLNDKLKSEKNKEEKENIENTLNVLNRQYDEKIQYLISNGILDRDDIDNYVKESVDNLNSFTGHYHFSEIIPSMKNYLVKYLRIKR